MINQSTDEFVNSSSYINNFLSLNNTQEHHSSHHNHHQFSPIPIPKSNYLQPIKIFQQHQSVPQQSQQYQQQQHHQFKTINLIDEIISPLSNSSSTSSSSSSMSSSSMSSLSSLSSMCNNNLNSNSNNFMLAESNLNSHTINTAFSTTNANISSNSNSNNNSNNSNSNSTKDKTKTKIKSLSDNFVSAANKSNQKKNSTKKKTSPTANDLDEERTSQLVSELLRNIKEKTKQLESLNQHMKSSCSDTKSRSHSLNEQVDSPTPSSLNTSNSANNESKSVNFQSIKRSKSTKPKSNAKLTAVKDLDAHLQSAPLSPSVSRDKLIKVPSGWQRIINHSNCVEYKSPTGEKFQSLQEIRSYLLASNTCKCGLECPLNINETFSFDVSVKNLNFSSTVSLTDLSNRLNNCCLHSIDQNKNAKRFSNEDLKSNKKKKITDENDCQLNHSSLADFLDQPEEANECRREFEHAKNVQIYQFADDFKDNDEFNLIQLNNDSDLSTNSALILDSAYLNSLSLNEDIELIQLKSSSVAANLNSNNTTNQNNENRTDDHINVTDLDMNQLNNQLIINNDLLISASLSANTPLVTTPHSTTSNSIIDFSATSISSKNIFNFYTQEDKSNLKFLILFLVA
jgi:hypothetical protein